MKRLDPLSLRLFVAAIETGSIAGASEREHIAATAVSKRIAELESELKTQLLTRTNKGVDATAAGQTLLGLARYTLHQLDDIYEQMRDYASGVKGQVRVHANLSAITEFLPSELKSFRAKYPDVQVQLEEKISANVTRAIAENAADIGIYTHWTHGLELELFPYHRDRLVLVTPAEHPLAGSENLTFAATLAYEYIGLQTNSAINRALASAAEQAGYSLKLALQVTGYDALCLMVDAGLGIGVIPEAIARMHCKTLPLAATRLVEPWTDRELRICVRNFEALPVAAKLLVNHLRGGARED